MCLRIKQSRPENLNDAIKHAVELHAFVGYECKRPEDSGLCRGAVSDSPMLDPKRESLENAVFGFFNQFIHITKQPINLNNKMFFLGIHSGYECSDIAEKIHVPGIM